MVGRSLGISDSLLRITFGFLRRTCWLLIGLTEPFAVGSERVGNVRLALPDGSAGKRGFAGSPDCRQGCHPMLVMCGLAAMLNGLTKRDILLFAAVLLVVRISLYLSFFPRAEDGKPRSDRASCAPHRSGYHDGRLAFRRKVEKFFVVGFSPLSMRVLHGQTCDAVNAARAALCASSSIRA